MKKANTACEIARKQEKMIIAGKIYKGRERVCKSQYNSGSEKTNAAFSYVGQRSFDN
jgi:hypothetical protein